MDAALFDLGRVLLDWDPRCYYRSLIEGEDALLRPSTARER